MPHLVAPSVLASNFGYLADDIIMVNKSQADWFHIDVMDGRFVPNISFGFPVLNAIQKHAQKPLDVHLMILEPEKYVEKFHKAGANIITVHYEACTHLHRNIQQIKNLGCKAGVALNPHTPVSVLENVIADIDLVLLMSVNPGFGGQKFIKETLSKIKLAKSLILQKNSAAVIEIDGGVSELNAYEILKAGADVLVAGSSVFNAENPTIAIEALKNINPHTCIA